MISVLLPANECGRVLIACVVIAPDEDVRRYDERQKKKAEPPVQVDEVDSCFPRTPERVGITLDDDPEGQCLCSPYFSHRGQVQGLNQDTYHKNKNCSPSILLASFQKHIPHISRLQQDLKKPDFIKSKM